MQRGFAGTELSSFTLTGGVAYNGGGIYLYNSSPTLTNCTLTGNSASYGGGGMFLYNSSPTLTNCILTGNLSDSGFGGIYVTYQSAPILLNAVLAYNSGYNFYNSDSTPTILYSDLYNPPGSLNHNLSSLDPSNLTVEPGFLAYDTDGYPSDLHLSQGSPLIDAGDPSLTDPDGSRSDISSYGGPGGDLWDRDGDGYPDYFWPGAYEDTPGGFDPADYDCDDGDATIFPGNGCDP